MIESVEYFSNARTALKIGLLNNNIKVNSFVLVPESICDVLIHPFIQLKINVIFYAVDNQFSPNWKCLENLAKSNNCCAVVMVHYFGQAQEIKRFLEFCYRYNLFLIEDNAHGSGGYFGKGIGEGTLKNRVPEAHTDYIISVISEEFGVVAIMLILLLFLMFIYMVFKKINYEKNDKTKLVLIGCVSLILMQATIHIGVNIRLLPTTGMTLPFLSYGGSSIVSISILSGMILNLTKRKINQQT